MIMATNCSRAFNNMPWFPVLLWTLLLTTAAFADAFVVVRPSRRHKHNTIAQQHRHKMGLLDSIMSNFLQDRGEDFVRLETTDTHFGPGPALILYDVPAGIANDEIQDMVCDGAPQAYRKGVTLARLSSESPLLLSNMTVADALEQIVNNKYNDNFVAIHAADTSSSSSSSSSATTASCPILYFSGFDNKEMMAVYQILGKEVFDESGASPACAKAVPNAMMKPLQQVLEEISGDHSQASATTSESWLWPE